MSRVKLHHFLCRVVSLRCINSSDTSVGGVRRRPLGPPRSQRLRDKMCSRGIKMLFFICSDLHGSQKAEKMECVIGLIHWRHFYLEPEWYENWPGVKCNLNTVSLLW